MLSGTTIGESMQRVFAFKKTAVDQSAWSGQRTLYRRFPLRFPLPPHMSQIAKEASIALVIISWQTSSPPR
jgi:hypothetical protein